MVLAHRREIPDLANWVPGTLNIDLVDPCAWSPPNDDEYRRASIDLGNQSLSGDEASQLLRNGNYFHPTLRVVEISGIEVDGVVYYPGCSKPLLPNGELRPVTRNRIEVCSKVRLRDLLGIADTGKYHQVTIRIKD
jgi:hypothetical protein